MSSLMDEEVIYNTTGRRSVSDKELSALKEALDRSGSKLDTSEWKVGPKAEEFTCQCMELTRLGYIKLKPDETIDDMCCVDDNPICCHLAAYSTIMYKGKSYVVNEGCAAEWDCSIFEEYHDKTNKDKVTLIEEVYESGDCLYCVIWSNKVIKKDINNNTFELRIDYRGELDGFTGKPQATISSKALEKGNSRGSYVIYMKGYLRGKSLRNPMIKATRT